MHAINNSVFSSSNKHLSIRPGEHSARNSSVLITDKSVEIEEVGEDG